MKSAIVSCFAGALAAFCLASPVGAQPTGKLVLYTSQPDRDAQRTVEGFRKQNPGVEVEIFRSGTTEVMSKLMAEIAAGAPRADVLLIADALSMEKLKSAGELMAYPGADVRELPPDAYDKGKTYFGTKIITTGIIVNRQATMRPASWNDLLKPEAKGQIALPSPLYSGAAAIHMAALRGDPALGSDFYEKLAKNGAVALRGNGAVLNAVANGEKAYGVLVDFMAFNAKAKGSPIDFIFPSEGLPAVTEPVAMLKTAQNPAAARAFVDFILSDDGQKLAASMGYIPARASVGMPSWYPAGAKINLMPTDIAKVVQSNSANLQRFAEMFGK